MATVAQESGALSLCSLLPDLYVLVGSILVERVGSRLVARSG